MSPPRHLHAPPTSEISAKTGAKPVGDLRALKSLAPYLWPKNALELRIRVVLAMLALLFSNIATLFIPIVYGKAVDVLSGKTVALVAIPVGLIAAYGLARLLTQFFNEVRNAIFQKVSQRAIRQIALGVFRHLHSLSLKFHLDRQTGGLSRAIQRGTTAIDSLLSFSLFNVFPTILMLILSALVIWRRFDGWYAMATVLTVGTYIVFTIKVSNWRIVIRRQMNDSDSSANTKAIDSLLNHETVKYFTNEEHEAKRYDLALARYEKAAVKTVTSLSVLNIGQAAIVGAGVTIIMLMSARDIVAGTMSIGGFVTLNTYLIQLAQPLGIFGTVYSALKQALVDIEGMFALLREGRDIADRPGAQALTVIGGTVEFRDVDFAYDPRRPILSGVSFTVPAGRTVAIVGSSGAGKSTIARLLFRFYDATGGAIVIDGQDIRDVTQQSLRGEIGIVPQDTVLFNDTIYYNIAYGRPDATREEVERAARMANIDSFIRTLPDGYDAMVGERGLKLSGGEKQRVAIARALLKDPAIMLFDEATSALDTATEKEIQGNLKTASEGRTTLIIAHRLSTIIDADEILVLSGGRIVERGTHRSLLVEDGMFAEMWRKQQEAAARGVTAEDVAPSAEAAE
ncbi:MAG: metal transporter permease [Rhodospirillales bacterium]|nr:metal transporter permease [Rhodospirillales bacterium]